MNNEFFYAIGFLLAFGLLVALTHGLHIRLHLPSELSRKFMHVSGGILGLFFPMFFSSPWWVLMLCGTAFLILAVTFFKNLLPGIHKTNRRSFGSIFFPIPVYICFVAACYFNSNIYFYMPVALLTFSDTMAEWGGKKWGHSSKLFFNGQKSLAGSLCFAGTSLLVVAGCFYLETGISLVQNLGLSILITSGVTLVELVSLKGFDNLTVPVSALILLILFFT